MTPRKRKRSKKSLIIVCIGLFILLVLGIGLYFGKSVFINPQPVFEEIYSIRSDLSNEIQKIDHSIYESLYINGIKEKNVHFSTVKPKYHKLQEWDFTEISIKLASGDSIYPLMEIIDEGLSSLKPAISYNYEKISEIESVFHVYVNGLYTHKIILKYEKDIIPEKEPLPRLAIIIDDLGYDRKMAYTLVHFELPLSLSILPMAPYTEYVAEIARENDREILLHLPMEPKNYPRIDPGPGALLIEMDEAEIRRRIHDLIKQVDGISGVNHHMGSCFTENDEKMSIVLSELKNSGLFYVDSRTSSKTVAYKIAQKMGVPAIKKNVFLDHDLSTKAIKVQMERLLSIARYSGTAVGIGHPHKETISILEEYKEKLMHEFKVVPVSQLVG
jgi:polysaccharide deacetylase 2 family uncharacterized protein YibQ